MNYEKTVDGLKSHVIDTTGILAEVHPIFSAMEVASGMSAEASINARALVTTLNYAGLGYVYSKGRDFSRKAFKITADSPESVQNVHDTMYSGMFCILLSPPIYAASQISAGETPNWYRIGITTLTTTGLALANGSPVGYSIDVFRDLAGREECKRPFYPGFIKRQS